MEMKPIVIGVLFAIIGLVVLNNHSRRDISQEPREISSYEYANLCTTLSLYPGISDTVSKGLEHDTVSVAQYNRIMHMADVVRYKQEKKDSARQKVSKVSLAVVSKE